MAGTAASAEQKTLLVFGDSLSAAYGIQEEEGWVALLAKRMEEEHSHYSVVNASVSGETTTGGLARLPAMLSLHKPSMVILELGGNDGLRGLPLANMKQNLNEMVDLITATGARTLLAGIQIPPNYGPRYTLPFFKQYEEIASAKGTALVPFLIDGIPQQAELMQDDGIHPKAEAQPMILDNVWRVLKEELEKEK